MNDLYEGPSYYATPASTDAERCEYMIYNAFEDLLTVGDWKHANHIFKQVNEMLRQDQKERFHATELDPDEKPL